MWMKNGKPSTVNGLFLVDKARCRNDLGAIAATPLAQPWLNPHPAPMPTRTNLLIQGKALERRESSGEEVTLV